MTNPFRVAALFVLSLPLQPLIASAQEPPYFVTYAHYLEEPGNLEFSVATTTGAPKGPASTYMAPWLELEYGVTGWWTTELYLEGVVSRQDGSGFAGWRLENRFRPLKGEHRVNPVLYVEYESISEASRIQKEVVGSGALPFGSIPDLTRERAHEIEGKLILSSVIGAWNLSENVVVEKNLSEAEGFEFGYSLGISRPLGTLASGSECRFCRENFVVGLEAYGGLGSSVERSLDDTRHFIAPVVGWHVSANGTLTASIGRGLTAASDKYLVRLAYTHEIAIRGDGK
jgi:hypothetical protein